MIFSATPGTIATVVQDPRAHWNGAFKVGPLANRIYRRFEENVARSERISWGDFLFGMVDVKPLHQSGARDMQFYGTASWSDFTAVRRVPMLKHSLR